MHEGSDSHLVQVDQALAKRTDVVLRIDVQGAATVKKLIPDAISIFIAAESEEALVNRLVARKTEDMVRRGKQRILCFPQLNHILCLPLLNNILCLPLLNNILCCVHSDP